MLSTSLIFIRINRVHFIKAFKPFYRKGLKAICGHFPIFYGHKILRPFLDHFLYDSTTFCLKTALLAALKQQFND